MEQTEKRRNIWRDLPGEAAVDAALVARVAAELTRLGAMSELESGLRVGRLLLAAFFTDPTSRTPLDSAPMRDQNTGRTVREEVPLKAMQVHDDIVPIAEFKTHAARIFRQLRDTGRPIVITQHGRPAGVLVPTADFDRLAGRDRFIAAVNQGLAESEAGLGVDDDHDLNALLDRKFGPLDQA